MKMAVVWLKLLQIMVFKTHDTSLSRERPPAI